MTFLDLIFAIVFMAIAVIALAVIRKNRVLTRQLDSRSRMMRDAFSENTRLKKLVRTFDAVCFTELDKWEIVNTGFAFLVCKRALASDEIALVARTYKYNPKDPDDCDYKRICAQELLDVLTESI